MTAFHRMFGCVFLCAMALAFIWAPAAAWALDDGDDAGSAGCVRSTFPLLSLDALPDRQLSDGDIALLDAAPGKSVPLLVICVGFDNAAYRDDLDWADRVFRSDEGISQYYLDMSGGDFTFVPARETSAYRVNGNTNVADQENDGVVHVNAGVDHDAWGDRVWTDAHTDSFAHALVTALDAADGSVDFSAYDGDRNGFITTDELAICFIVAGYEASYSPYGVPDDTLLWAHASSVSAAEGVYAPECDGVQLDSYVAIAENIDDEGDGTPAPIGVVAHELGHYLGLPDLYDTAEADGEGGGGAWAFYEVSELSLMADGGNASYYDEATDESVYRPTALDAWSRFTLGWTRPVMLPQGGTANLRSNLASGGYATALVPTGNDGEYYLLENRQFEGWDRALSSWYYEYERGGIVVWHIDQTVIEVYGWANRINDVSHRPGVVPLFLEGIDDDWSWKVDKTFADGEPYTAFPFFCAQMWDVVLPGESRLLTLPQYGAGEQADVRTARTASPLSVQLADVSSRDMAAQVSGALPPGTTVRTGQCGLNGGGYVVVRTGLDGQETLRDSVADDQGIGFYVSDKPGTYTVEQRAVALPDTAGRWYEGVAADATAHGIINGVDEGGVRWFRGDKATTRAEFIAILYNMEGEPAAGYPEFSDMSGDEWYAKAAAWGQEQGLLMGYPDGTFRGTSKLTREQLVTFLQRYADWLGMDTSERVELDWYEDAWLLDPAWSLAPMQWANAAGLVTGYADRPELGVKSRATRAETAAVMMRLLGYRFRGGSKG